MAAANKQLERIFRRMAEVTEILGGNRFRVIAFEKTARVIGELAEDIAGMSDDELEALDGIGRGTRQRIREYLETGEIQDYQKLMGEVPEGILKLLEVPGLGPKTVARLWREAGVTDLDSFKAKLDSGELEALREDRGEIALAENSFSGGALWHTDPERASEPSYPCGLPSNGFADLRYDFRAREKARSSSLDMLLAAFAKKVREHVKRDLEDKQPTPKSCVETYLKSNPGFEFTWFRTDQDGPLSRDELRALEAALLYDFRDAERNGDTPRLNTQTPKKTSLDGRLKEMHSTCLRHLETVSWNPIQDAKTARSLLRNQIWGDDDKPAGLSKKAHNYGPQGLYFMRPRGEPLSHGYIGLAGEKKMTNAEGVGLIQRLGEHFGNGDWGKGGADSSFIVSVVVDWEVRALKQIIDVEASRQKTGRSRSRGKLRGFGKKKIAQLKANLAFIESAGKRVRLGQAMALANWFVHELRKLESVKQAVFAGSLRRGKETIGDIDLLVAAEKREAHGIADSFARMEVVQSVIGKGLTKTSIRTEEGIQVDLRIVEPTSFGAALVYFTGSKEHNVRLRERALGMKYRLSEYGLFKEGEDRPIAGRSEQQVYEKLKLAWIAPELREDRGEIALAEKGKLPTLIERVDIKAELHTHTTASDGHWSIRELAAAAADRGFHTIAITDHSRSQVQAHGLDAKRLEKHIEAIRDVAAQVKGTIRVLAGTEVDILSDGKLDYPDSLLKQLDIVVASPHAALAQDAGRCTDRLLKAIDNRYVTILGHPTGRMVNRREGLHPDMKKLLAAAAKRGIALEINANHYRLDLRDTHARAAIEAGCKLSINTDAHGPADLDQLLYGVLTARRAGAEKGDVINCLSQAALGKWIGSTRG